MSSLLDESTVQSKLVELTSKITTLKVELDESNDAKTMLEQQLESSMIQCKGLQDDLQTKVINVHEFEEKLAKLEHHSLEQEGILEGLRDEKRQLQEASDDLKAQNKGKE